MTRILAVASAGGHFVQLLRLRPAFEGCEVSYMTTCKGYEGELGESRVYVVGDASRWNKVKLAIMLLQVAWVIVRVRPSVIITTGAAPGYFALRIGKLLGARCVWLDSIANAEEMSMGGRMAGRVADLWLTQWEHLARDDGPRFAGAVV